MINSAIPIESASFGSELFKFRTNRGRTQAEVAQLAQLNRGYYSQLENSRRPAPPERTLVRIANALGLTHKEAQMLFDAAAIERLKDRAWKLSRGHNRLMLWRGAVQLMVPASTLRRIEKILAEEELCK